MFFPLLATNAKRERERKRGAERKREYTLTQLNSSVDKKRSAATALAGGTAGDACVYLH